MKGDSASRFSKWADETMDKYYNFGININESISKIATSNNLTDEQISRIIEETNQEVYLTEYNKVKSQNERDVQFKIASLSEIRSRMDNCPKDQEVAVKMASCFSSEEFIKEASEKIEDTSFLTKGNFGTTALTVEKPVELKQILVEKIAETVDSMNREIQIEAEEFVQEISEFGEALLKYAQYGYDMQDMFSNICMSGEIRKSAQIPIIKTITKRAEQMLEEKTFPSNIDYKLSMVDTLEKVAEVSLGKHSLNSKNEPKDILPSVLVSDKKIISNVKELINMASQIQSRHEMLKQKANKQKGLIDLFDKKVS